MQQSRYFNTVVFLLLLLLFMYDIQFVQTRISFLPLTCFLTYLDKLTTQHFPLTSLSNNPPPWIAPQDNLNIQSFLGHSQNSGGKKNSSKQKAAYFPAELYARSRESGLVEGPLSAAFAQETFGKKDPAPALGLGLFSDTFFPVFLLSVIHFFSSKCWY